MAHAMLAFDTYNALMLNLHGVPYPFQRYEQNRSQWKACWEIALLCLEKEWNVEIFIQEALTYVRKSVSIIHPRALLAAGVVDKFDEVNRQDAVTVDPVNTWVYYTNQLNARIVQDGDAEDVVLYSPVIDFPAWFRLFAGRLTDELYDFYADEARETLLYDGPLRKYLRANHGVRFAELERRWGRFKDSGDTT